MGLFDKIGSVLNPVKDMVDDLTLSKEEKEGFKAALSERMLGVYTLIMGYESQLIESKEKVLVAEAQSQSWLTRNWRPMTMVTFVALIVARMFGWTAEGISDEEYIQLWSLVKIGLGGYVVGRSAEKVAPGIVKALTQG